jgi:hypothetical protein
VVLRAPPATVLWGEGQVEGRPAKDAALIGESVQK